MEFVFRNGVKFNSTTSGTSDFTIGTNVTGFRTPSGAGCANGETAHYRAESADKSEWEHFLGTYNSGTGKVERTTVLESSAGGTTKVTFSAAPVVGQVVLAQSIRNDPIFYPSTTTITIPPNKTSALVTLVGASGGSSGVNVGCVMTYGGAGGGGAGLEILLTGLTPGNTLALTIGAAGAAGASGTNNGGDGGNTSLASGTQTITTQTANGGKGGVAGSGSNNGYPGKGGAKPSTGDIAIAGGAGLLTSTNVNGEQEGTGGLSAFGWGRGGNISAHNGANQAGFVGVAGKCRIIWMP